MNQFVVYTNTKTSMVDYMSVEQWETLNTQSLQEEFRGTENQCIATVESMMTHEAA